MRRSKKKVEYLERRRKEVGKTCPEKQEVKKMKKKKKKHENIAFPLKHLSRARATNKVPKVGRRKLSRCA